jgi:dipeptidase D
VPPDYALVRFEVSGLRGGHSGIDIHLGRGNAIKLLAEALRDLSAHTDVRLVELKGGTARNAIPREAYAVCALPADIASNIDEWVRHRHQTWRLRFAEADAKVSLAVQLLPPCRGKGGMGVEQLSANASTLSPALPLQGGGLGRGQDGSGWADSYQAIANADRDRLLAFLDIAANGVARISDDFPGVTDTSSNLGVAALEQGAFKATFKVRSLHDARADALADKLVHLAVTRGMQACKAGAYPGWTPNPSSPLLDLCQRVYTAQFGQPASLQVIHAGLECGLLAASHPHLDMISFGPDIRGAHAPGESVEIESVARCWQLLKAVLRALAKA